MCYVMNGKLLQLKSSIMVKRSWLVVICIFKYRLGYKIPYNENRIPAIKSGFPCVQFSTLLTLQGSCFTGMDLQCMIEQYEVEKSGVKNFTVKSLGLKIPGLKISCNQFYE